MEVVNLVYCAGCGAPTSPADRFCGNCGTPTVLPPGYVPYMPMAPPPHDRTAMIVVIVIVVVLVGTIGLSAVLYVMVSGLIGTGPPTPIALGVTISRSSNGANWSLTFTSVPSNVNPTVTSLSLYDTSGLQALSPTALTALAGSMVPLSNGLGSLYLEYAGHSGAVAAGDLILIGTMTSLGATTTGYRAQLVFAGSIVWTGTLQ